MPAYGATDLSDAYQRKVFRQQLIRLQQWSVKACGLYGEKDLNTLLCFLVV